ncbi:type II toxin-antitoxin system PemK/MazF family toxin [Salicibibacter cibi]|uniref:Type II toxin-antitoxin system PemK/MazF family toxin n=1 Tax=Salicibibacter cibi TaxID=2743001 RepID=A0A7T6Z9N4_9BACI|nr:type II toxin-antitoxin system PemK/MazF family toxin [Salicibibacter cibi]QQK78971.1 type II toxin-antitoxin system PemK/MazF family toxin [Salicibibacter cibi]
MTYKQGDIILIPFPFSDLTGNKKRPALILNKPNVNKQSLLICMMISSVHRHTSSDIPILEWNEAGLLKPSVVRVNKIFTIDGSMVLKRLGCLNQNDFKPILSKFFSLFE